MAFNFQGQLEFAVITHQGQPQQTVSDVWFARAPVPAPPGPGRWDYSQIGENNGWSPPFGSPSLVFEGGADLIALTTNVTGTPCYNVGGSGGWADNNMPLTYGGVPIPRPPIRAMTATRVGNTSYVFAIDNSNRFAVIPYNYAGGQWDWRIWQSLSFSQPDPTSTGPWLLALPLLPTSQTIDLLFTDGAGQVFGARCTAITTGVFSPPVSLGPSGAVAGDGNLVAVRAGGRAYAFLVNAADHRVLVNSQSATGAWLGDWQPLGAANAPANIRWLSATAANNVPWLLAITADGKVWWTASSQQQFGAWSPWQLAVPPTITAVVRAGAFIDCGGATETVQAVVLDPTGLVWQGAFSAQGQFTWQSTVGGAGFSALAATPTRVVS